MKVKIAVAQINPTVGDLEGNGAMMLAAYMEAAKAGADLIVMPEMCLTGYPLEDLVLRESFRDAVSAAGNAFCQSIMDSGHTLSVIWGQPQTTTSQLMAKIEGDVATRIEDADEVVTVTNVAYLLDPTDEDFGGTNGYPIWATKYELPNYGVFDEKRVFSRSSYEPGTCMWRGIKLGLMICEDAWFPAVTKMLADDGAQMLISINGSPFEDGKNVTRRQVVANRVKETGLPFLYVNLVGGQDELVFDGGSFLWDGEMQEAPYFETGLFYFETHIGKKAKCSKGGGDCCCWDWHPRSRTGCSFWTAETEDYRVVSLENYPVVQPSGLDAIYRALVLGTRDYMEKQNFKSVVLGYSGGVDSGIVAAIAADAVGPDNVHLVRLPSKFSSQHSLNDASEGCTRLGAKMRTINIEPVVEALRAAYVGSTDHGYYPEHNTYNNSYDPTHPRKLTGVSDENIQARARGNILMSISNQEGHLLLTTGNKSEVSVGYSTLYGDMSGGFNPIKDCYKVTVWELCRWRNSLSEEQIVQFGFRGRATDVVPEEIIVKPPSAELRPDQQDSDSLPPYPVLDAMLKAMIEEERGVREIAELLGVDLPTVTRIRRLVDLSEYKRRQAAPGVKISSKIHGRDRRYPITNRWRG
jgi:NAD+ synthetase